ncbi:Uncharacterized protein PCOAH_00047970 [Plasmodium coatneyi]|uniref:KIR protein n=1 Tax=Plasmodium coatneyi TaxID=208452 RepID=A0A1B1E6Z5_9APIC|nr:Uncharacterized protein PCOAH_00047970 [Plasmodium coatneyi]ANQ10771.1 Uncharacterized protein PCOAH_00047970 [Plasmodium coatneyi]
MKEEEESLTLPSERVYVEFIHTENGCGKKGDKNKEDEVKAKVKVALGEYSIEGEDIIEGVANAYCYACNEGKKKGAGEYYDYCHFLYHWIGDEVMKKLKQGEHQFGDVMEGIYKELAEFSCTNKCSTVFYKINQDLFELGKKVFDYKYDYTALQENVECQQYSTSKKLGQKLTEAQEAYSQLPSKCNNDGDDEYCKTLGKKDNEWDPQELSELTCTPVKPPKPGTVEVQGQQKDYKPTLYSEWVYHMLHNGYERADPSDGVVIALKGRLSVYSALSIWSERILAALEFVSTVKRKSPRDNIPCYWFYYWLGDKVQTTVERTEEFSTAVNSVYDALRKVLGENKCDALGFHSSKDKFEKGKKLFDLKHDHNPNNEQLQKYYELCNSAYQEQYKTTPPKVPSASDVKEQCKSGSSEEYCTKFMQKYGDHSCQQSSSELKCNLTEQPESPQFREFVRTDVESNIPAAISSILGAIVGLPVTTFFLYKVSNSYYGRNLTGSNNNI